jgi:hypothetical protein
LIYRVPSILWVPPKIPYGNPSGYLRYPLNTLRIPKESSGKSSY